MKYLFIILAAFSFSGGFTQQRLEWAQTSNWKLYAIHDKTAFTYPLDKLPGLQSIILENDSMQYFLSDVSTILPEKSPVWMGVYIATCELRDGTTRKIDVSVYGGFFYDDKDKMYYQLPLSTRKAWLDYLADRAAILESLVKMSNSQ